MLMVDCADVGLIRTPGRSEMLYPRSKLVTTAKAFGLQAIDLVRLLLTILSSLTWCADVRYVLITKTQIHSVKKVKKGED
jgi:hypothetical protein